MTSAASNLDFCLYLIGGVIDSWWRRPWSLNRLSVGGKREEDGDRISVWISADGPGKGPVIFNRRVKIKLWGIYNSQMCELRNMVVQTIILNRRQHRRA